MLCCLLLTFSKLILSKLFRNIIKVSNRLDPDQIWDLNCTCLKRLSAADKKSPLKRKELWFKMPDHIFKLSTCFKMMKYQDNSIVSKGQQSFLQVLIVVQIYQISSKYLNWEITQTVSKGEQPYLNKTNCLDLNSLACDIQNHVDLI